MTQRAFEDFIARHDRLFVLTGAGCSTESGIPDYRDESGNWKRAQPVSFQSFVSDLNVRKRYWARSLVGWRFFGSAQPNNAHRALASLEQSQRVELLVTQNVDRLHQAAGSERVIDLHGRMDHVSCLQCRLGLSRSAMQTRLEQNNPEFASLTARTAPDGDADLADVDFKPFNVPSCEHCGGLLKPDVVFFGEGVPKERVSQSMSALANSDAMLVVGSSLMVLSGYRFARAAANADKPIAAVNLGRTRADDLLSLKVNMRCSDALNFLHASDCEYEKKY